MHSRPLNHYLFCTCSRLNLPRFWISIDHHITTHRTGSTTDREFCSSLPTTPPPLSRFGRPPTRTKVEVKSLNCTYDTLAIQVPKDGRLDFFKFRHSYPNQGEICGLSDHKNHALWPSACMHGIQMSVYTIQMSVHRTMSDLATRSCDARSRIQLPKIL